MLHIHVSVQWHDEVDDAHVYEIKCNFVGAKHLGCYSPYIKIDQKFFLDPSVPASPGSENFILAKN